MADNESSSSVDSLVESSEDSHAERVKAQAAAGSSSSSQEDGKATLSSFSALDSLGAPKAGDDVKESPKAQETPKPAPVKEAPKYELKPLASSAKAESKPEPVKVSPKAEPAKQDPPKKVAKEESQPVKQATRLEVQADATAKWERQQTTAFTYWVNVMLARRNEKIDDLRTGFHTGVKLALLAEVLTGKKIDQKIMEKPKMIAHKITNNFIGLKFLKEVGGAKALTISAEQLVETTGDLKYILGFCWQLLKTFQEPPDSQGDGKKGKAESYETKLLNWVKTTLGRGEGQSGGPYANVDLSNGFKSAGFRNGTALAGLVHNFDNTFLNYSEFQASSDSNVTTSQCKSALQSAQDKMNIPAIIDGEDLASGGVDDKQLVLYLSLLYNAYTDKARSQSAENLKLKSQNLDSQLRLLQEENVKLKAQNLSLTTQSQDLKLQLSEVEKNHSSLSVITTETQSKINSLIEEYSSSTSAWDAEIAALKAKLAAQMEAGDASQQALHNQLEESTRKRDQVREELKKMREQIKKEREELEKRNKKLLKQEARAKKNKEDLDNIINRQDKELSEGMDEFRKHLLIHLNDMNTWRPILEDHREYD